MLFLPDETGQGLLEYALILVLIAVAVVAIMGTLGRTINNTLYQNVISAFE